VIAAALVAGVFVLYVVTYASIPTGDGYWFLNNIAQALVERPPATLDADLLINPPSALTQYFFFIVKRLTDAAGLSIATLTIIQTVNAAVAGAGAALMCSIVRYLGGGRRLGVLSGALLAVSFGYWPFANGERQLLSLVVLLLIFKLIVRVRMRGEWSPWFVASVGFLNALAVLLRQENVLFGFAAVALLGLGRSWRSALRDAVIYGAIGSLGTSMGVFLLAESRHAASAADVLRWYVWAVREHVGTAQDFQAFEHATAFDVPRVVKGQLTAFIVGTQAVVDILRNRSLLARPTAATLATLTLAAYVLMAVLAAGLSRLRRVAEPHLMVVTIACSVWLLVYKVVVHGWLWPSHTRYQVDTVPPLVLLLILGAIAPQKSGGAARPLWRTGCVAGLVVLVFLVDLWGGILPFRRYGDMWTSLEARHAAEFRPDDLFVSCESGIDTIFARLYRGGDARHVSVKNEFVKSPAPEAFATIRAAIVRQLDGGGRVFVYNFVPAPYSFIAINQSPVRGGTPLSARDFEAFLDELRKAYAMRPLFDYWEESKAPLYLFGERREPFFELSRRS